MSNWHILPVNDIKKHIQHEECWCDPRIEVMDNGDRLVIHNSKDQREFLIERIELNYN